MARALGTRTPRWLGRISYSLYLWHWPLLILVPILIGRDDLPVRLMIALAAIGIAALAGLLVVLVMGGDPGSAFGTFLWSSLGSLNGLSQTLNKTCPLLLGGLAVGLALLVFR